FMNFQLATKPLSFTSRVSGNFAPVKLGLAQLDRIFILFSLARAEKSSCSEPLRENVIRNEWVFTASAAEKASTVPNASLNKLGPGDWGLVTRLLPSQLT